MTECQYDWEHDPVNPKNWSPATKWIVATLVSLYCFVAQLASSIMAPSLHDITMKYGIIIPTVEALTLSIFFLSSAVGPLFGAPLSEVYGCVWVLHLANLFLLVFNLSCALSPNMTCFIVLRFLGPSVGPIIGGFIAESVGIQYVFYLIAAICGVAAVLGMPILRETYAPVIRLRRDKMVLNAEKATTVYPVPTTHRMPDKWAYLWINLKRPIILLTRSFICFILSLTTWLIYIICLGYPVSIYYLMFATFPGLFSDVYHFSVGIRGLAYLGIGLGCLFASAISAKLSDSIYIYNTTFSFDHLATQNEGNGKPEMRVPALIFGLFFVPVGLFWYGWSAQAEVHWIMPIIGTAILGFGIMTTFLPIHLYLIDSFTYAASAVAAVSTFHSLLGFTFPLFGEEIFAALGYGGGNSLLTGFAIILGIPFPVWIYYASERTRAKS
ncbi:multidrug resistance protein 4 [Suillus paluster]|uniref:multidrug resistance protein 4 n=1 Tax=Suillus paluster TaxID=48578 RepID=UPI001B874916|nr:multidrug resistance protein 4 [Suillus paluster]KAG1730841.1 multidrug resistance protein 4 [Suillus paluster]